MLSVRLCPHQNRGMGHRLRPTLRIRPFRHARHSDRGRKRRVQDPLRGPGGSRSCRDSRGQRGALTVSAYRRLVEETGETSWQEASTRMSGLEPLTRLSLVTSTRPGGTQTSRPGCSDSPRPEVRSRRRQYHWRRGLPGVSRRRGDTRAPPRCVSGWLPR
jgi:hypothetical protein